MDVFGLIPETLSEDIDWYLEAEARFLLLLNEKENTPPGFVSLRRPNDRVCGRQVFWRPSSPNPPTYYPGLRSQVKQRAALKVSDWYTTEKWQRSPLYHVPWNLCYWLDYFPASFKAGGTHSLFRSNHFRKRCMFIWKIYLQWLAKEKGMLKLYRALYCALYALYSVSSQSYC